MIACGSLKTLVGPKWHNNPHFRDVDIDIDVACYIIGKENAAQSQRWSQS